MRISFGKGWGGSYKRPDITLCPCWLEVLFKPQRWQVFQLTPSVDCFPLDLTARHKRQAITSKSKSSAILIELINNSKRQQQQQRVVAEETKTRQRKWSSSRFMDHGHHCYQCKLMRKLQTTLVRLIKGLLANGPISK